MHRTASLSVLLLLQLLAVCVLGSDGKNTVLTILDPTGFPLKGIVLGPNRRSHHTPFFPAVPPFSTLPTPIDPRATTIIVSATQYHRRCLLHRHCQFRDT
jgi:hypothetical protein